MSDSHSSVSDKTEHAFSATLPLTGYFTLKVLQNIKLHLAQFT